MSSPICCYIRGQKSQLIRGTGIGMLLKTRGFLRTSNTHIHRLFFRRALWNHTHFKETIFKTIMMSFTKVKKQPDLRSVLWCRAGLGTKEVSLFTGWYVPWCAVQDLVETETKNDLIPLVSVLDQLTAKGHMNLMTSEDSQRNVICVIYEHLKHVLTLLVSACLASQTK